MKHILLRISRRAIAGVVLCWFAAVLPAQTAAWTLRDAGTTANLWAAATDGNTIVVVGEQGTLITSTDAGTTWISRDSGTTAWLTSVAFSAKQGRFFAVGDGGVILSSTDGTVWHHELSPTPIRLNAVAAQNNGWVYAVGEAGAGLLACDPATGVWTRYDVGFGNRWMRGLLVQNSGAAIYATGQGGAFFSSPIAPSGVAAPLGTAWDQIPLTTTSDIEALCIGARVGAPNVGEGLVMVGADGTILESADQVSGGQNMIPRSSGTQERLRGVCWRQGGGVNVITLIVNVIIGEYFAVGTHGTILRSRDGVAWLADPTPTRSNLNAILNGVLAVGDGGTILQLDPAQAVPVVTSQPTVSVDANGQVYAEAAASGSGALTYYWLQVSPGAPQPVGADGPRQLLSSPKTNLYPGYAFRLIVGNAFGLAGSRTFALNRFLNLSGRAVVGPGEKTLISGFAIKGVAARTVLVRAIGPTLAKLGVAAPLAAPKLSIFSGSQTIATNSGWSSNSNAAAIAGAAQAVGAFALPAGSADSAVLLTLQPGVYTAQVASKDDSTGTALVEVYDVTDPSTSWLKNLSARGVVGTGANVLIGGLVIDGGVPKRVLLRAAGPALTQFGVEGVLANPQLTLFHGSDVVATATAWNASPDAAAIQTTAQQVGAFAFADGSTDAAMLLTLAPGAYTLQITGADGGSGVALAEVYEAP